MHVCMYVHVWYVSEYNTHFMYFVLHIYSRYYDEVYSPHEAEVQRYAIQSIQYVK